MMLLRRMIQGTILVIGLSGLNGVQGSSPQEWEGESTENNPTLEPRSREFVDETMPAPEENPSELVDVSAPVAPLRQNQVRLPRKGLAMVQVTSTGKGIKDETAITGENAKNAKKRLPSSTKEETEQPVYLYEINRAVPQMLPMDSR